MMNYRAMLAEGNRRISPCNLCDVNGGIMGEFHAKNWGLSIGDVNK